jgi:hypothetical protein
MMDSADWTVQETQRVICAGEDLLERTQAVAQEILERINRALDEQASASPTGDETDEWEGGRAWLSHSPAAPRESEAGQMV